MKLPFSQVQDYNFTTRALPDLMLGAKSSPETGPGAAYVLSANRAYIQASQPNSPHYADGSPGDRAPQNKTNSDRAKVCVIDDNDDALADLEQILHVSGYEVLGISRVIGASNQIREYQPDLILVSGNLASLSGEKLITVLKKNLKSPPIMIMYADLEPEQLEQLALESQADDYMVKNGDYTPLLSRVRYYTRLLGKH